MTTTGDAPPDPQANTEPDPRRWYALAVLCLSLLIVFVGNSSLNVTLPTLSRELHATSSQLQWVVAVYSLVFAGLLFSTGAIGDRFGRKGTLQAGLFLFLIGAGAASRASAMWQLIGCRAIMGAAGALIMPATLSIIINTFPANERPKAIAIWASVTGVSGSLGPLASGWLLGHFWFGSVFLINLPIIVIALVAGFFLITDSKDPGETKLDPPGAVLSTIGIVALVYGLIQGPSNGWASPSTIGAFVFAAVVLAAFVWWELRVDEPMLDIRLFKLQAFSIGSGGMILVFLSMYGVFFLITQYFQLILGYTPLSAALRFLPVGGVMILVAPMTPRLVKRFGAHRTVAFGMALISGAMLMFLHLGLHTSYWYVLVAVAPLAAGIAMAMAPMTASIMSAVPEERAGQGSAMNDATRELGAALGVAILGSLAASKYHSAIDGVVKNLSPSVQHKASISLADAFSAASKLPHAASQHLVTGSEQAFVSGVHIAVAVGAVLAGLSCFIVYRFLPHSSVDDAMPAGAAEGLEMAELDLAGATPAYSVD